MTTLFSNPFDTSAPPDPNKIEYINNKNWECAKSPNTTGCRLLLLIRPDYFPTGYDAAWVKYNTYQYDLARPRNGIKKDTFIDPKQFGLDFDIDTIADKLIAKGEAERAASIRNDYRAITFVIDLGSPPTGDDAPKPTPTLRIWEMTRPTLQSITKALKSPMVAGKRHALAKFFSPKACSPIFFDKYKGANGFQETDVSAFSPGDIRTLPEWLSEYGLDEVATARILNKINTTDLVRTLEPKVYPTSVIEKMILEGFDPWADEGSRKAVDIAREQRKEALAKAGRKYVIEPNPSLKRADGEEERPDDADLDKIAPAGF